MRCSRCLGDIPGPWIRRFSIPLTSVFISSAEKTAAMTDFPRKAPFTAFPGLVKILVPAGGCSTPPLRPGASPRCCRCPRRTSSGRRALSSPPVSLCRRSGEPEHPHRAAGVGGGQAAAGGQRGAGAQLPGPPGRGAAPARVLRAQERGALRPRLGHHLPPPPAHPGASGTQLGGTGGPLSHLLRFCCP